MSKASQYRQKAQDYLNKGKVGEAIDAYKKLLQVESRNPNLYNELGDIYLRAEDRMQAVMSFEKAVDNYEKVALYNNAVAVCKKILRVVPNRLESIFKLGELKAKQKFSGEASRLFIQYFDLVTADGGGARPDMVLPKVEMALGLVPEDDELHSKAGEVLTQIGLKIAAAEVFAKLIVRSVGKGDSDKTDLYRGRLDLLRGALSPVEQTRIEEILSECIELSDDSEVDDEPDLTVEEIDTTAAAEAAGSDPAGIQEPAPVETPAAAGAPVQEPQVQPAGPQPAPKAEYEIPVEPQAEPVQEYEIPVEPQAEPVQEYEIPVEPQAEPVQEYEIPVEPQAEPVQEYEIPVEPQAEPVQEYEIPVEPVAVTDPEEEYVIDEAPADDKEAEPREGVTTVDDDLSDILEEEDAANEGGKADTRDFAREITSDVEENDFRSHYDLGMAYIEMALYNESIKELQISARSEQLQLRSLEMIGHCFLLLENPRLAVKQLNRGLEIAMNTGGDNLGIHYNLGLAYEALEEHNKAREHFEEVYIVDVTFREISSKMKKYSTVS